MGIGSMLFVMPQLISERWSIELETINNTDSSTNICRNARVRDDTSERLTEYGFGTLPGEWAQKLAFRESLNCILIFATVCAIVDLLYFLELHVTQKFLDLYIFFHAVVL